MEEAVRRVHQLLAEFLGREGADEFTAAELQGLAQAGYASARRFRSATRDGLGQAGLLPASIDAILGAAAAGPSSASTTGGAAAGPCTNSAGSLTGVFQGLSISSEGGMAESIFFPSQACFVAFKVFNNSSVALQLASHARAVIASGQISHKSPSRSDFTLVFLDNEDGQQRMSQFLLYLRNTAIMSKMKVLRSGAEVGDEAAVRFEAGGDRHASQDGEHLRMLESSLDVQYATQQLQLSMEREEVQEEHLAQASSHSLGRSSESFAAEE